MSGARLHTLLPELTTRQPVMVVGAAVIDVIADAYALPWRGCDIELKQQSVNVGGCALNIAVALKRLGIEAGNALPLGQGVWAEIIRNRMAKEGLISLIDNAEGDNGWCLALVEPDGERTFMSFSGVENQWNREWLARLTVAPGSLLYFSGYQLASPCGELLVEWLEELQDVTPFIDFGPRIGDIPDALLARIMACRPLVSLNRQEAEIAAERFALSAEITTLGKQWQEKFAAPLIVRLDKEGAWYFSNDASGCIPAFPTQVVDTIGAGDSHAGGVLAGWPLVCHWRMPYYWAMQWRRGLSGIGAVIVRQRARNYSSHTKTYRSLRQWLMLYSIGRCCWSSATCLITSTGILLSN